MSAYYYTELPWTLSEEDEQRFRRILKRISITFLILGLLIAFLPAPKSSRMQNEELPPRLAKLVLERQESKPPAPVKPVEMEAPKAAPKPKPVEPKEIKKEVRKEAKKEIKKETPPADAMNKKVEVARKRAASSGLLALRDELADLRANAAPGEIQKTARLGPGLGAGRGPGVGSTSGPAMGKGARSLITSNVAGGSGGITTSKVSIGTGGGGLAGRATTQVNSPIGGGGGGGGGGDGGGTLTRGGGGKAARSIEDIRLVFDRNKSAIYALYSRVLRQDPTLQGKVLLKITITPSGQVSACQVVSSELHSPELERKLAARVMQFDFGAKDVGVMVVTYPVDFLPS